MTEPTRLLDDELSDGGEAAGEAASVEDGKPAVAEPSSEEASEPKTPARSPAPPAATAPGSRRTRDPVLARAFRTGRPVQGSVERVIKGGFEVRVGRQRAFCPFSQMDLRRVERPEDYAGQTLYFKVIQFRRGGEDVVLSRRAILAEERSDEAKAVRATLIRGSVMQGHVVSLTEFGAFVDLGAGVTGLVHLSELSHARVEHPSDAVQLGQAVAVKILKIDEDKNRISLSIRQAQHDPWDDVRERFRVGETYSGKVTRIEDFGAFIELAAGIEALAHSRDFPPHADGWQHGLRPELELEWRVLTLEPRRRRMAVIPAEVAQAAQSLTEGATVSGKVQRVERFGVFVWLGPGNVGLIPNVLTGTPKGTDLGRRFPVGSDVQVDVLELQAQGRRIRLAVHGVTPPEAAGPSERRRREVVETTAKPTGNFANNLGDALRAALGGRQDGA